MEKLQVAPRTIVEGVTPSKVVGASAETYLGGVPMGDVTHISRRDTVHEDYDFPIEPLFPWEESEEAIPQAS